MMSYFVSFFFFFYREAVLKFAQSRVIKIVFFRRLILEAKRDFLSSSKFFKHHVKISFALIITYNFVEHFEKTKKKRKTNLIDF